jgi:hypothetical protein
MAASVWVSCGVSRMVQYGMNPSAPLSKKAQYLIAESARLFCANTGLRLEILFRVPI